MHFTSLIALTAALGGVSALPSPHAHAHQHAHQQKRAIEFKKAVQPHHTTTTTVVEEVVSTPAPEPTTSTQAPEPTTSTAAAAEPSSKASSGDGAFKPFCGGKKKRATLDQIMYAGNVGSADDWGCNMQIIDAAAVDKYDYTTKFSSTGGKFTCSCFNKVGPKGLLDGFWFSAVDFSVSEAGKDDVYMAFDTNSQGGCACGEGDAAPRTPMGQLAGAWLEFDWGSEPNGGNSGADASVLVAGAQKPAMPWIGMSVAYEGKVCSWVKSDGTNEAAYMPGMEDLDGIGCKGYHKGQTQVLLGDNFNH